MRLIGFRSVNWEQHGYRAGVPGDAKPFPTISPNVLYRAGAMPLFGPSQIGEAPIPCEFVYRGALSYEEAWTRLLSLLNAYDVRPGELRARTNGGVLVKRNAILTIPGTGSFFGLPDITSLPVIFVSNEANWSAI